MPMYEYECQACGTRFERRQRMTEDALTTCEECGGSVRRVPFPVGIIFKGSGFYATDNRKGSSGSNGKSEQAKDGKESSETKPTETKAGSDSKATSSSDSSASKPAEKSTASSGS